MASDESLSGLSALHAGAGRVRTVANDPAACCRPSLRDCAPCLFLCALAWL